MVQIDDGSHTEYFVTETQRQPPSRVWVMLLWTGNSSADLLLHSLACLLLSRCLHKGEHRTTRQSYTVFSLKHTHTVARTGFAKPITSDVNAVFLFGFALKFTIVFRRICYYFLCSSSQWANHAFHLLFPTYFTFLQFQFSFYFNVYFLLHQIRPFFEAFHLIQSQK